MKKLETTEIRESICSGLDGKLLTNVPLYLTTDLSLANSSVGVLKWITVQRKYIFS